MDPADGKDGSRWNITVEHSMDMPGSSIRGQSIGPRTDRVVRPVVLGVISSMVLRMAGRV